ncbi:MAG: helix-turn-helix domain-containing protein [Candidatus Fimivivens sp.]|nr:helix-turn-helix domain-containing protein [Candidatus Fimivivens sp.]
MPKYYTCAEIADMYRVKTITVWDWVRKKKLPAVKAGKSYLISEESIKTFEDERKTIA